MESAVTSIILGPPGTGKTTTLLRMVEQSLERGTPPDRIALVTFTTRGAQEARDRAMKKFRLESKQLPHFSTIHALCYRGLGLARSDILMGKWLNDFADYARIEVTGRAWSDDGLLTRFKSGDRILFMENLSRIRRVTLQEQYNLDNDGLDWNEVQRVAKALRLFKQARGLMDFTDMLTEYVHMDTGLDIDELFVDESQDLSALQWSVVDLLARNAKKVSIAGDDDQAIYRWAGADVEHLVQMDGDASVLGQSWRVPKKLQAVASGIISGIRTRRPKKWRAREGSEGVVDRRRVFDDVNVDTGDVLVLARNDYVLSEQVIPALREQGVVYEVKGSSSISEKILHAVTTWEDLRKGEAVRLGEAREMYGYLSASGPNRSIKHGFKELKNYGDDPDEPVTMRDLVNTGGLLVDPMKVWHDALDRLPIDDMSYMLAARRRGEKLRGGARPRVRLSTIHAAKGSEAEHVVLMKEMAQRTNYEMMRSTAGEEDERRVFYVGVTRAKERLTIVSSQTNRECPWL